MASVTVEHETTGGGALDTVFQRENRLLAPYAQFSANTRGRKYPQPEHPYRGPYQRDRDRVVHSAAFRRLADKTQVFTGMGDYHRTRLTHTMEVASIARTISRALRLNEDLTEALAIVHDLGHPPFGHAGEEAIDEFLSADGGFSHNRFALTLVEELELRYAEFPGLNLSLEVLDSQIFRIDKDAAPQAPLLEAQVVDTADSITYDAHDTDDAVKLGFVALEEMLELPLLQACAARIKIGDYSPELLRGRLVHDLIERQVSDVVAATSQQLERRAPPSAAAAQQLHIEVHPGPETAGRKRELESFLYNRVYRHPNIVKVRDVAQTQMHQLLTALAREPARLPRRFQQRGEQIGLRVAAADYVAGMTESFFHEEFGRICGGS